MSDLEENAFQIARYLLENPGKDGHLHLKETLHLSDVDFRMALKFLVDEGCFKTYGSTGNKDAGIREANLAKLQNFRNRISEKRILLPYDAERLIKFIVNNPNKTTNGDAIMTHFQWDQKQYMDAYDILKVKGFIDAQYADNQPYLIWATNKGKEIVIDNFRLAPQFSSNTTYNISSFSANNSIVNVGATLTSVNQSIQTNSYIADANKKELETLLRQLNDALNDVPVENGEDAETVAETAKTFVENATKEKPNKSLVKISSEGLRKAAENIAAVAPKVLQIAQAIIIFIKGLHSSND